MKKKHQVFISFSRSFLFFVIIPVLVLNIAAWQAINITEKNESRNFIGLLEEGRDKIDTWIRNSQTVAAYLRREQAIHRLERLGVDVATEEYYDIWRALQSLGRLDIASLELDVLIYYPNPDLVLSPAFMAGRMSDAYGTFFRFGDNDYAGFLSASAVSGIRPVFFPVTEHIWEMVPLRGALCGMQLRISGSASLFFLLREGRILSSFSSVFFDKGALYIYDAGGSLLFSRGGGFPSAKIDTELFTGSGLLPAGFLGPGIIGAYSRSNYGLLYVSAQEKDMALNHVRTLKNLTFVLNIAAILLSLGYAVFLAARNSRQLAEAFRRLDIIPGLPAYQGGNSLNYLNSSVVRLINTNTLLREDARSRQEILRAVFLDRLLEGAWEGREAERRLGNQLQNADFEGARQSIHSIFTANMQDPEEPMLTIFYATLQGCFLKSLKGPLMDHYRGAVENLDFSRSPRELEEDFTGLARQICASFAAEYAKKNAFIKKEELTAYVEDHFSEEGLSLRMAARHFGFSETYFSQMFKETTGENFSTFTEITRLNHAQTLLKQYLKVEEAAVRCGYKSPGSFRRAYKRYFGINPARSR